MSSRDMSGPASRHEGDGLAPIDLVLGQGSPADLQRYRELVASDPLAAVEIAETRHLLEQMRELRVEPSTGLGDRLEELVRRSTQREERRRPTPTPAQVLWSPRRWTPRIVAQVAGVVAAAVLFFALLVALDPFGSRRRGDSSELAAQASSISSDEADAAALAAARAPEHVHMPIVLEPVDIVQVVDQLFETDQRLTIAWDRYRDTKERRGQDPEQRLAGWLSPQNQLATLRWDYELRTRSDARLAALRNRGQLPAVERRVQILAQQVALDLLGNDEHTPVAIAVGVRALLAAGGQRDEALRRGVDRLTTALPALTGGELASVLAALGDYAVATGTNADLLRIHGQRLLREVVSVDDEIWTRRRPRLVAQATPAAMLADAGRFLAYAPAFGLDSDEALFVRLLVSAHLQERRAMGEERPETLTALAYGFGDLLEREEMVGIIDRLRVWSPLSVVPDYASLHHLIWTQSPATQGYARFQLALRRVFAQPTPRSLADRSWLCLCLAASFRNFELGA